MSGLVKPKKYDWKDSNLALFGSDTEKQVKKSAAQTEEAWKGAGADVGLQIWRIVKFKVKEWPKEDYGKFYSGDSYIILNTYKEPDSDDLEYDVHFWIGQYSTQDEYGTAAYKTVELDTLLDDEPIQHREVQGHESDLFKSYFKEISIMKGGADTGFRHVKPTEYTPRLMHFKGEGRRVTVKEVPLAKSRLNSGDVFILDQGLEIYQWNGKSASKDEKFKAVQFLQGVKSERGGKPKVEILEEDSTDASHKFYAALSDDDEDDDEDVPSYDKKLLRLSDQTGSLKMDLVGEGSKVTSGLLDSSDVFILDHHKEGIFVWIGKGATDTENKNAMTYAHKYAMSSSNPLASVSCIKEATKNKQSLSRFQVALTA